MSRTRLTAECLEERLAPALGDLLGTLSSPTANIGDSFGVAVAVDGDLAVVGVPADDPGGVTNAGSAYVINITTGAVVATLNNPAPAEFDFFGSSVAISGTGVVVGAPPDDPGGVPDAGTVYVFDISTGPTPAPLATLNNPTPAANEYVGQSVAISGTRVVVGALDAPGGLIFAGSAYVFDVLFGPTPFPIATLNNPTPAEFDNFGQSVAISGTRVVVGAPGGPNGAGSAYVFDISVEPTPTPFATLNNPSPAANDTFGGSVAISGTRAVVGAPGDDPGGVTEAGSAYVFDVLAGPAPTPLASLNNPTPAANEYFGSSVAIGGTRAVVGAPGDAPGGLTFSGSAYVFDISTGPAPLATLHNPTPAGEDFFGGSVALSGTRAVVGVYGDDPGGVTDSGSAYVFDASTRLTPLVVSGPADGRVEVLAPGASGRFDSSATLTPFPGFAGSVRTAVADVDRDGFSDTVLVTGPGTPIRVAVVSGADNSTVLVQPFDPFGGDFTGGGFVTAADFDGDGRAEFVVTPDQGGGPRISIFSLGSGGAATLRANFLTIEASFRGGARPAAGDVNADGTADLVVSAGFLGGPRIVVLDGRRVLSVSNFTSDADKLVGDFFAFSPELRNGAYVAIGDVNGDGFGDLVFGAGPGGGPEIRIASGRTLLTSGSDAALSNAIADFFLAGDLSNRGGVRVTVKDADGDGRADVVAGTGGGQASFARVYLGKDFTSVAEPTTFQDLDPFGGEVLADGVYVG